MRPKGFFVYLLFAILISFLGCKKSPSKPEDELSKLPGETRSGAGTFGCLVNGKALRPSGGGFSGPSMQATYIYLKNTSLHFYGIDRRDKELHRVVTVTVDKEVKENGTYTLQKQALNQGSGEFFTSTTFKDTFYNTDDNFKGELHLTRFDEVNQIVSGTFWFDAVNEAGDKVEVRSGRFDLRFTR